MIHTIESIDSIEAGYDVNVLQIGHGLALLHHCLFKD